MASKLMINRRARIGASTDEADALLSEMIPGYDQEKTTPLEEIANKVILARTLKGLTQAQVADMAGTSPAQISRLESGEQVPDATTLDTLARVLEFQITFPLQSGPLAGLRDRRKKAVARAAGGWGGEQRAAPMWAAAEKTRR